jgi:hypothetical protein
MHHVNNHIDILIRPWLFFDEPFPTAAFRNHPGGGPHQKAKTSGM